MLIAASTRPRNLKRGTSMKKFCKALGFEKEVGLTQLCGKIELSAEEPAEFGFLLGLYKAFCPLRNQATKIVIEIDGAPYCTYSRDPKRLGGVEP